MKMNLGVRWLDRGYWVLGCVFRGEGRCEKVVASWTVGRGGGEGLLRGCRGLLCGFVGLRGGGNRSVSGICCGVGGCWSCLVTRRKGLKG
jgi:hypothetical protein